MRWSLKHLMWQQALPFLTFSIRRTVECMELVEKYTASESSGARLYRWINWYFIKLPASKSTSFVETTSMPVAWNLHLRRPTSLSKFCTDFMVGVVAWVKMEVGSALCLPQMEAPGQYELFVHTAPSNCLWLFLWTVAEECSSKAFNMSAPKSV